jgi:hypothetical protein
LPSGVEACLDAPPTGNDFLPGANQSSSGGKRKVGGGMRDNLVQAHRFGTYGSGVPGAMGGSFFRLCSNSARILIIGPATHALAVNVAPNSSLGSLYRSKIFGTPHLGWRRPPVSFLLVERYLPVLPLDRFHPVGDVYRESFSRRRVGAPEQKLGLIDAVDRTILRYGSARDPREGSETCQRRARSHC